MSVHEIKNAFSKMIQTLSMMAGVMLLMSTFSPPDAASATRTASSVIELQSLINSASPGDIIQLANGTYVDSTITILTNNITVSAATPGGVFLNGSNSIVINGNHVKFSGFQFTSGSTSGVLIDVRGSHNALMQLNFKGYSAKTYILFQDGSQYNEVSYSNFENKPTAAPAGSLIQIVAHPSIPGYHKIRYSSFQNVLGLGGDNGNENIRLSNGAQSTYVSRTVVEFNYFSNTGKGDSEAISVKCRENVLRYNTFTQNPDAMMVFRNGNDNIAYGNFFIDAGGIRLKEANNIYLYNNYFERAGVGGAMNAVTYDYVTGNLKNINFLHNTFVEPGKIDLSSGATSNTWANNIFVKKAGDIFTGSADGIRWYSNLYSGASLGTSIPASGMKAADPKLFINSDGYSSLSSSSPAIDASTFSIAGIPDIANVDDDPTIRYDASMQFRNSTKDIGSDEFVIGDRINRPLKLSDVGPSYLGGPSGASQPSQPPSVPVLSIGSPTKSSLTLNWVENTAIVPVTGFDILRCSGLRCTPSLVIASVGNSTRKYTNSGLPRYTTYTYAVKAKNGSAVTISNFVSRSTN